MEPVALIELSSLLFLSGALVAFVSPRIAYSLSLLASIPLFAVSAEGIGGFSGELFRILPTSIRVDPLSALFILILAFLGLSVSVYLLSYRTRGSGRYLAMSLNLSLLSALIFFATDSLERLTFAYELFAVFTFVAILTAGSRSSLKSAWRYLVVTQLFGIIPLLIATALAYSAVGDMESLTFEGLRGSLGSLPVGLWLMYALYLSAFLVRAGVFPFHTWVTKAYRSVPSPFVPVFIIGEGMGFYGILRMTEFALPTSRTVGYTLAVLGSVSVFATLYAFREIRLKTKFAHQSVMDVGIAFFALGASMVLPGELGGIVLIGAILHVLYQSIYKSAIFFGLGAIEHYGEEPNICSLRKLLKGHVMSVLLSLSAFSMAAVPPLAAFVSKWPIFAGIASSSDLTLWLLMLTVAFLGLFPLASIIQIRRLNRELCKREVEREEIPPLIKWTTGVVSFAGFLVAVFPFILLPWLTSAVEEIRGSLPSSPSEVFFHWPGFVVALSLLLAVPYAGWRVGRIPTERVSELLLIFYNAGDILSEVFNFFVGEFKAAYLRYVLPVIKVIPRYELSDVGDVDDALDYPVRHLDEAMFMPLIRAFARLADWGKERNLDMNALIGGFAVAMALLIVILGVFA